MQTVSKLGAALVALVLVLLSMNVPSSNHVLAAISVDGWGSLTSGTTATLNGIWGTSSSDLYVCGDSGKILQYDGTSWSEMPSGVAIALSAIWGTSSNNIFAVGQNGTIVSYNGTAWNTMPSGTSSHLNAIWGSSADSIFAVGNTGTVVSYNGTAWAPLPPPLGVGNHFRGIWGTSASDMFVVGDGGILIHYDGISWELLNEGSPPKFAGIWGASSDDVFVVGSGGTIGRYDGNTLIPMTSGISDELNAVWGSSSSDVFAVGTHGTILHYDGNPDGVWTPKQSGTANDLLNVWGINSQNVYAVGRGGVILHYKEAEPVILSVSPNQADQGDTLSVTIDGSNFLGTNNVSFGQGIEATWVVENDVHISANITIASGAAVGPRDLSITNHDGTGWLYGGFNIPAAQVTGVNPSSGDRGQTLTVVVSGINLGGTAEVSLGSDITVNAAPVVSPTQVAVNITIGLTAAPGLRYAYLVIPDGDDVTFDFTVNAPAPTLTGMSPSSGYQGGALEVTLTGTNLAGVDAVSLGQGIVVGDITVDGPNQIRVEITIDATASAGDRTITVTTAGGSASLSDEFTVVVPPPALEAIDVTSGRQKETLDIVLTGTELDGATAVSFGEGITVSDVQVDSATQVTVSITIGKSAEPGLRDVSLTTPGGTTSLTDGFDVQKAGGSISPWWWVGLALILLLIGLLFFMLMRRKKAAQEPAKA